MTPNNHSEDRPRIAPPGPGRTPVGRSRAQRARMLRRRVISGALALFVAAWLLIAVVLASGHDPALAARKTTVADTSSTQTATTASTPTTTTTSTATPTTTSSSTPTTSASSASPTSGSTSAASSVTTRQS